MEWEWFGNAGHLCVSDQCRFHLATKVGDYLVSTVGEYYPSHKNENDGPETIGYDRLFETMVFKAGEPCSCGCGLPTIDGSELDMDGYNDAGAANKGHLAMCYKWENKEGL